MAVLKESEDEIRGSLWWSAGATRLGFPRRRKTFPQRIGFIGTRDLCWSLDWECQLRCLTRANWRVMVAQKLVDLILVEPCLEDATGDWYFSLFDTGSPDPEMSELLAAARQAGIPLVCWITYDALYEELLSGFGKHFDRVFCCDRGFAEKLEAARCPAEPLSVAVQPSIFNAFTEPENLGVGEVNVLYEGWTSLISVSGLPDQLARLVPHGLRITEPSARVSRRRQRDHPGLASSVLGSVSLRDRLVLLKRARIYLQSEADIVPRQQAEQRAVQAAACRTVVVYHGTLPNGDARRG